MSRLRRLLKFHPDEVISPVKKKFLLVPHVCFSVLAGFSALFDEQVRQASSVVQVFGWLNPTVMGIGFLIAFATGIYTLVTGAWRTYAITNILVFALSMSWLLSLFVTRFIYETLPVSAASFGIWLFIVTDCVVIAAIHNKVISTKPKL